MSWLLFGLFLCLLCTIGMNTKEVSGDIVKGIMTLSICSLIAFVVWSSK
ncbi:MAG: hypothetical protein RSB94_07840 [Erysipelotrichaceae bacterium]